MHRFKPYPLSLHDALPIYFAWEGAGSKGLLVGSTAPNNLAYRTFTAPNTWGTITTVAMGSTEHRKSTRLNSSHVAISYAIFCLKKKNRYDDRHNTLIEA